MVEADPSPRRFRELMLDEQPGFADVLACVFGIQEHEVRTYLVLHEHPGSTVAELADQLERDRSNVNRSLSQLRDLDLAYRERRLLDSGGYVYQYGAEPLPETKKRLHDALDRWADQVHDRIDAFGEGT